MVRFPKLGLIGLVWLLVANSTALAQSTQGSITGVVTDPRGAAVVAASVTVTETNTNIRRTTTTNGSGLYNFPDLPPGTYMVSVSAPGFKETKSSNINLVAAASSRFDATLDVGRVSESVTVSATAPTLNTETAETGHLVTGEDIIREPMQRSALQLLVLAPGSAAGRNNGSSIMLGGQRSNYENLTVDGVTNMNNLFGGQAGHLVDQQSFESIAEVKIVDGNGSADTPGFSSLITTTKSGTNQVHGSGFYSTDNSALNSDPFGSNTKGKGPELQWYGGSIGGPVFLPHIYDGRNKTFFFVTVEHRTFPLAAGGSFIFGANLPTAAFQGKTNPNGDADFSSLLPATQLTDPFNGNAPFVGNIIPHARLNSVALALQNNFYPPINDSCPGASPDSFLGNYCAVGTDPEHINRYDVRIDHNFSNRDTLSARFTRDRDPEPNNYDSNTLFFKHGRVTSGINTYVGETHTFSPTILNEFRLSFSRDVRNFQASHDGNSVLKQIGLNLGVSVPPGTRGFPDIGFNDVEGFFELGSALQIGQEYALLDNVNWQKGNHSIKAGALLRYGRPQSSGGNLNDQFGTFFFDGSFTGFDYADFLLGVPVTTGLNNDIPSSYPRKTDIGLFAQDSWHANHKLTLTYGLRWEYYMPPVDNNDRRASFDPATGNVVVPDKKTLSFLNPGLPSTLVNNIEVSPSGYPGRSLLDGRKTNFGPRLGFAYLLDRGTVVRGAYGIYHAVLVNAVQDQFNNSGLFGIQVSGINNSFTNNVPAFQFPNPFSNFDFATNTCSAQCLNISGATPHLKTPTTQQWNLTVERDLGHSLVARVGYRGFMTTQIPITDDLNIPRVAGSPSAYPLFSKVLWTTSGGIQKMHSLEAAVERKFTGGMTFQSAYTLQTNRSDAQGTGLGDGEGDSPSNPYDRAADMGNVYFTSRHRVVNNVVWDVPFGRGQRFGSGTPKALDEVVGGWEVSGINVIQSGRFLTPTIGTRNGLIKNNGAALRPDCSGSLTIPNQSRTDWFNTSAFSLPAAWNLRELRCGHYPESRSLRIQFRSTQVFYSERKSKAQI